MFSWVLLTFGPQLDDAPCCVCVGALPSVKLPWNVSMVSSCASDKQSDIQIIASHATAISTMDPCPSICHTEDHLSCKKELEEHTLISTLGTLHVSVL